MVIFRIQVTDRDLRRRYLAVEAAMEDLAPSLGVSVDTARLAGLGVGMDAQLAQGNGARRGEMAVELLGTDRAPRPVLDAVGSCRRDPAETLSPLAAGLYVAEALVLEAWSLLAPPADPDDEPYTLDTLEGLDLVARLRRRARVRGEPEAERVFECADRLDQDPADLAEQTLGSMRRVREDLGH